MRVGLGWVAMALMASGCTAIKATYHVSTADQAVREARSYGAQEHATYEYTMALRYLDESKERLGFDEYRVCEILARKSLEWADKALISLEEGKRIEGAVEIRNEDLPVPLVIPPDGQGPPPMPQPKPPAPPPPVPLPVPAPAPIQFDQWGIPIPIPIPLPQPAPARVPPPPEPTPPPKPDYDFGGDE